MTSAPSAAVGARPPRTTGQDRARHRAPAHQPLLTAWLRWAAPVFVLLGVLARLRQWAGGRSLWLDEVLIADNLVHRGFWSLVAQPLAHHQVAPPLWLELEHLATVAFGTGERALRLVPLLAGLATLGLAWVLARRVLPDVLVPVAVLLVALNPYLVYYSNEVKQYSTDVAVVLLLVLLAQEVSRRTDPGRALRRLAIAGAGAVWLSHAAILVLAGLSAALVLRPLRARDRHEAIRVVRALWPWAASAALLWLLVLRQVPQTAELADYWAPTFPHSTLDLPAWLVRTWYALASNPLHLTVPVLGLTAVALGAVRSLQYGGRGAALLWAGVPVALLAAAVHAYPFAGRLALWLVPAAAIALAATLPDRPARVHAAVAVVLLAVVTGPGLLTGLSRVVVVQHVEELRPLLQELAQQRQPADVVLVETGTEAAFDYYAQSTGVRRDGVIVLAPRDGAAGCSARSALDAGQFLTQRVWVVISHRLSDGPRLGTAQDLLTRLRAASREVAHLHRTSADAYLFDPIGRSVPALSALPVPANPTRCLAVFRSPR